MSTAVYADSSLLVSLYLSDANTPQAIASVAAVGRPLLLTHWQQFELENALQLRLFRRESTRADLAEAEQRFTEDLAAGAVLPAELPLSVVLPVARRLTARHTALVGCRAFDVFHVAAAIHLRAARFLTFDVRQRALARAAGLRTAP